LENIIFNKSISNEFLFSINNKDILFVLTRNNSIYEKSINNMISKMFIVNDSSSINLDQLSQVLQGLGIMFLNIVLIDHEYEANKVTCVMANKHSPVSYIEMGPDSFINIILNNHKINFLEVNKNTLYILKNGCFSYIKALFSKINGCEVNLCKGKSQKAHLLSHLDLRLSTYLMALYTFDYQKISSLNGFSVAGKYQYLSWLDDFKSRDNMKDKEENLVIRRVFSGSNISKVKY